MTVRPLSAALTALALLVASTVAAGTLTAAEAGRHVGEDATVCGLVANAKYAATSRGAPTFLNLDRPYPNHIFTILIWGTSRSLFPYQPESLTGRSICVTGTISTYKGIAQIEASSPSQIKTKDAGNSNRSPGPIKEKGSDTIFMLACWGPAIAIPGWQIGENWRSGNGVREH